VAFLIQQADLEQDRQVLIAMLHRYVTAFSNEARFDWLYSQNPHGPARAWLAKDSENGEVVGTSAAFPRRATLNGTERTGWVLGDFCVADKYRSLGPALQLQRATLAAATDGGTDFYYDFPSRKMMAIYKRCGVTPAVQVVRLAKPLRLKSDTVRSIPLARSLGNALLRLLDLRIGFQDGWSVMLHEGSCGAEFTECSRSADVSDACAIQRSAEYLNWRYLRHPYMHYEILTVREAGDLQGYVVFSISGENANIAEWCVRRNELLKILLRTLISRLRNAGTITVDALLAEDDPRLPLFQSMGFWRREFSPVVAHWPETPAGAPPRWLLMEGDRDS
jgi:hypothetical protein